MVSGIGHVEIPGAVHRNARGKPEASISSGSIRTADITGQTRDSAHDPVRPGRYDFTYRLIIFVAHIKGSIAVQRHNAVILEPRAIVRSVRAAWHTRQTGNGADYPIRPHGRNSLNRTTASDVDVTGIVHRHAPALLAEVPRQTRDSTCRPVRPHRRDFSNSIGLHCDIKISQYVHCDASWIGKPRSIVRSISAAGRTWQTNDGTHHTRGTDFSNGVVEKIRDINVSIGVRGDALRKVELRLAPNPVANAHTGISRQGGKCVSGCVVDLGHHGLREQR